MKLSLETGIIPGTILKKADKDNKTGMAFLDTIFFVTNGVMLTQIREISGVDGSTLQNWVKRGWVGNTVNKKYSKDQLARILIINMLRSCMLLERVDALLHYINGTIDDKSDDIIPESQLFDYICSVYDQFSERGYETTEQLSKVIQEVTAGYVEPIEGARIRLNRTLEIILIAYFSSVVGNYANHLFLRL